MIFFVNIFYSSMKLFLVNNAKYVLKPQNVFLFGSLSSNRLLSSLHSLVERIVTNIRSDNDAIQLFQSYYSSNDDTRYKLLNYIANNLCVDVKQATNAVNHFIKAKELGEISDTFMAIDKLRTLLTPNYINLFNTISKLDNGVKFIVDLRADLLGCVNELPIDDNLTKIRLRSLSTQMKDLLSLWFSVGFLHLERITWDSPTSMLQKVSEYEAVHPMRNWLDLKRRVGQYRRCYVFTHSCLPREPLVILHVALTKSIASSIQDIIDKKQPQVQSTIISMPALSADSSYNFNEDPSTVDCAIFYSISSTQKGLNGIELGNTLIKRVLPDILSEFPQISQFSSLSPIPNFTEYLLLEMQAMQRGDTAKQSTFVKPEELSALKEYLHTDENIWQLLMAYIKSNKWFADEKLKELLRAPLSRKCAHYLFNEKRRGYALNYVAHFHLRNGAVMWRINWLADISPRGLSNSCGFMVNYRYYLENAESNSNRYFEEKFITAGEQVLSLVKS